MKIVTPCIYKDILLSAFSFWTSRNLEGITADPIYKWAKNWSAANRPGPADHFKLYPFENYIGEAQVVALNREQRGVNLECKRETYPLN